MEKQSKEQTVKTTQLHRVKCNNKMCEKKSLIQFCEQIEAEPLIY